MLKIALLLISISPFVFSQIGSTGVPFLSFSPSGEANGMGGIMSYTPSSSPTAKILKTAQLGFLSKTNLISTEFYTQKPHRDSPFFNEVTSLDNYVLSIGHQFSSISMGLSYSRIYFDLGKITLTNASNPMDKKTFHFFETSDNFSFGIGFQLGIIKSGFGITVKQITSRSAGQNPAGILTEYVANSTAADIGLLFNIPLVDLVVDNNNFPEYTFLPFADLNFGYAINNFGNNISYADLSQSDPLPRTARLGWSAEVGYRYRSEHATITLGSIMIAREAEEYLFARHPNGNVYYKNLPTGNMNISKSLIEGKYYDYVTIRKGFAVSFLETITIRSGSFQFSEINAYGTNGITVSTNGIFKILSSLSHDNQSSIMDFIFNRFEIRYNQSQYSGSASMFWGTDYKNITISIRH